VLSDPDLLAAVGGHGSLLAERCLEIPAVVDVRGRGLMLGLALAEGLDAREVARGALEAGLVVNAPNPATVRLLPPLVISEREVLQGVERLAEVIGGAVGEHG
jgi:acetylornithine/N-succinyldiaminopimelate aminotransferase